MKTAPAYAVYLMFFFTLLLVTSSCSKDSDLFAEAVLMDTEEIVNESSSTEEEQESNEVTSSIYFLTLNDAYIQNVEGFNHNLVRLEEDRRVSYLMFDLNIIDGEITKAELELTITADSGDGLLEIFKGDSNNWSEESLDFSTAPDKTNKVGSIDRTYKDGETIIIELDASTLEAEKTTFVITHSSGNDLAFASKENNSQSGPKLIVHHTGNTVQEDIPEPEVDEQVEEENFEEENTYDPSCDYGGSCKTPNTSCLDSNYPAIAEFIKAGVIGGIPDDLPIVETVTPVDNLQAVINGVSNDGGGVILMQQGTYSITETLSLRNGVVLRGTSKEEVILESTIRNTNKGNNGSIYFPNGVSYAGIENLTYFYRVDGCEPIDDLSGASPDFYSVHSNDPCGLTNLKTPGIFFDKDAKNNWVDNCNILESGTHPIHIRGHNNTIRNSFINRTYNKGPSGVGYFYVQGTYNLIVNNDIQRLRHLTIDNGSENWVCKYNVIYKNRLFRCEVNFHNSDNGYNLVEQNVISPEPYHHVSGQPINTGELESGHLPPGLNNYIYNNDTSQSGKPNFAGESGVIYSAFGFDDIRATNWLEPSCNTFYPMVGN